MSAPADARKRWLRSRRDAFQPSFSESFDGGFAAGVESAWAAAEQLIEDSVVALQAGDMPPPSPEGILEAFAEARHDERLNERSCGWRTFEAACCLEAGHEGDHDFLSFAEERSRLTTENASLRRLLGLADSRAATPMEPLPECNHKDVNQWGTAGNVIEWCRACGAVRAVTTRADGSAHNHYWDIPGEQPGSAAESRKDDGA